MPLSLPAQEELNTRPVAVVADFTEIQDVSEVIITEQRKYGVNLLFDSERPF